MDTNQNKAEKNNELILGYLQKDMDNMFKIQSLIYESINVKKLKKYPFLKYNIKKLNIKHKNIPQLIKMEFDAVFSKWCLDIEQIVNMNLMYQVRSITINKPLKNKPSLKGALQFNRITIYVNSVEETVKDDSNAKKVFYHEYGHLVYHFLNNTHPIRLRFLMQHIENGSRIMNEYKEFINIFPKADYDDKEPVFKNFTYESSYEELFARAFADLIFLQVYNIPSDEFSDDVTTKLKETIGTTIKR